jgi:ubiquinone biosynthesis protein COQ9
VLNLASNNLGELVPQAGWTVHQTEEGTQYYSKEGQESQWEIPKEPAGDITLASAIKDMRALSSLNLAENNLGELVLPEGWTGDWDNEEDKIVYEHTDGRTQT